MGMGGGGFGGFGAGQTGLDADPANQREVLMQRAARLEKLLQTTYQQIEKLDEELAAAQEAVVDTSAEIGEIVESVDETASSPELGEAGPGSR